MYDKIYLKAKFRRKSRVLLSTIKRPARGCGQDAGTYRAVAWNFTAALRFIRKRQARDADASFYCAGEILRCKP